MFSLYCLFLFFRRCLPDSPRIHYPTPPPAFKTIIPQPPGSSYQRQPDGEAAARPAAPPDLLIERDGRHCRASLRFASLLLHPASPTPL